MTLTETPLYRRTLIKPESEGGRKYDRNSLSFLAGALDGMKQFAERYLGRHFVSCEMPEEFPDVRDSIQDGELMVDAYRTALQDFYSLKPNKTIFTLDLVPNVLRTDSGRIINATSWQYRDLQDNCRLIDSNHAAVILTRNPPMDIENQTFPKNYLLAWHELGHLVLGNKPCEDNSCIHSHPPEADRARLLEEKAKILRLYETNGAPICRDCEVKLREFRDKFN